MSVDGELALSRNEFIRQQTEQILRTGTTEGIEIQGKPVVLVTMRGAKSGKLRALPLMRITHDGVYALVASYAGAPQHPRWYWNLKANPKVTLQDGTVTKEFVAREVTGEERDVWWERAVATFPQYAEYQKQTDRQIPIFVLEPEHDSQPRLR